MKTKLFLLSLGTLSLVVSTAGCAGRKRNNDEFDPNKTHIVVATLDKGIGTAWLENAARAFEDLYKERPRGAF